MTTETPPSQEKLKGRMVCMCCKKDLGPAGTETDSHGVCNVQCWKDWEEKQKQITKEMTGKREEIKRVIS